MLTNRQEKFLFILQAECEFRSIQYYSSILGVSKRTVYNETKILKNKGFDIRSKRGEGIKLYINKVKFNINRITNTNIYDRRMDIIKRLIFDKETLTIKGLSEEYYVSQTSIKNDFQYIKNILAYGNNFDFIKNQKGTKVQFESILEKILVLSNFNTYVLENETNSSYNNVKNKFSVLEKYYDENIVKVAQNIVFNFVKKNIEIIFDTYVDNFLNVFIALISTLKSGKHFNKEKNILDIKKHAFYVSSAENMLFKASTRLGLTYTKDDVEYLSQLLINYKLYKLPSEKIDDQIILDLITNVSCALNIDFSEDRNLFERLKVHIPAMIYRLKMQNPYNNPFTSQVKLEYPITFNVLSISMVIFEKQYEIVFNEDEIAFLTLHFQVSIENMGRSRKILVVCNTGIVTSQLLVNRIKNILPSIDEIEIASSQEFKQKDFNDYDYILLTTDIQHPVRNNILKISPFIKDTEIIALLNRKKKDKKPKNKDISKFLDIKTRTIKGKFVNKNQLIETACDYLIKHQFVSEGFKESVFNRESLGSTEFPNGVAIPHGELDFVKTTVVLYIENTQKIKWNETLVDQVFMLAISKKDISKVKTIISKLNNLISEEENLLLLKKKGSLELDTNNL